MSGLGLGAITTADAGQVDRVDNAGVKLLGPRSVRDFTTEFVNKKLKALDEVSKALREVNDAQVEFGLFRGCLSYNKINHLLRTCPPELLEDALAKFDEHFQNMVADILRVGCLGEDQWEQDSQVSGSIKPRSSLARPSSGPAR